MAISDSSKNILDQRLISAVNLNMAALKVEEGRRRNNRVWQHRHDKAKFKTKHHRGEKVPVIELSVHHQSHNLGCLSQKPN